MAFVPGEISFNRIYIIQSLKREDRKTGDELLNDIIFKRIKTETAELKNIETKDELYKYLHYIKQNVQIGYLPFIHFETHGYKDGISLSDGSDVSWKDLVKHLLEINILTRNNLFISMAACKGGNIQFSVNVTEPCPFRGFIGPMDDVGELDLLNSYNEFFDTLLKENDFEMAIHALNLTAKGVKYHHLNAESFFDVIIKQHEDLEKNDPGILRERVEFFVQQEIDRNPHVLSKFNSKENLREWIENSVIEKTPEIIESLKKRFCHIDQ